MATTRRLNPPILWAQRKDTLYLNIDLQDVKDAQIDLQPTKLTFSGTAGGKKYACNLEFFGEVDKEKSKYIIKPRAVEFILAKKTSGPYWDRLLKEPGKKTWIKTDFNKWKDENEADDEFDMSGMSGFDMGNMDFGNMGDDKDEDSDDDDLPDLKETQKSEGEEKKEGAEKKEGEDEMKS